MATTYDIIIIGGGVIGCMIARTLSRYKLNILLIEKESDIGMGASSANSAIIHSGHDPVPGTLKAEMNIKANPMWDQLSNELNFPFERRGAYIVAVGEEQLGDLEVLRYRAKNNGVAIETIPGEEILSREPKLNPEVSGALFTPSAGLCDPFAVTIAAAENAVQNRVVVQTETSFVDFIIEKNRIIGITTNRGKYYCRWLINAAGLYADDVMHKAGICHDFKITPRKGEYFVLDRAELSTEHVLFPVPTKVSKGILVLATLHGNTILGPNAVSIENKEDTSVSADGLQSVWQSALNLFPALNKKHIIATFTGLRASGNAPCKTPGVQYSKDFIIETAKEVSGMINLGGIESPGLTAAPAIADRVVELLEDSGELLVLKKEWNPIRLARPRFRDLNHQQRAHLIEQNPSYARIICRCEMVTEGEILAEIHSLVPARTYDAIKRRTWLGTGRCLGSFDMPRVVDILVRELKLSPMEVTKKGVGSEFLYRSSKGEDK